MISRQAKQANDLSLMCADFMIGMTLGAILSSPVILMTQYYLKSTAELLSMLGSCVLIFGIAALLLGLKK